MKTRKIAIEERIRLQSSEIKTLQEKYNEVKNEIERLEKVHSSLDLNQDRATDHVMTGLSDLPESIAKLGVSIVAFFNNSKKHKCNINKCEIEGRQKHVERKSKSKGIKKQPHDAVLNKNQLEVLEDIDKIIIDIHNVTNK
jgi:predicted nuclease with TOPRIM domain